MQLYNMRQARTQLSELVERAAKGESFVIGKGGKPMVMVVPFNVPESTRVNRFGFMAGQIKVPEDFNTMGATEIQKQFQLGE